MVPPISGGFTKKRKWTLTYPNIPSALRPVPHGEGLLIPEPPKEFTIDSDDEDEGELTWGFLNRGRVPINRMSLTASLLRHIFSHRTNWTILLAIWSSPRAKQSYWHQDFNNGIFSKKMSALLLFLIVISSWSLSSERKKTLVLLWYRWSNECPRNQTWPARMATIYRLFETES